jgi:hypothetical protein
MIETVIKRSETLRNVDYQEGSGNVNGPKRSYCTYCTRSRPETFAKLRSRYGHVHAAKTKELLYNSFEKRFSLNTFGEIIITKKSFW